jgi:hypothetical protein
VVAATAARLYAAVMPKARTSLAPRTQTVRRPTPRVGAEGVSDAAKALLHKGGSR